MQEKVKAVTDKPSKNLAWSSSACYLLHAGVLLGLFFDPEDVGDMLLLETSVRFATDSTALYPRR
jgi:hypothetical protein